MKRGREVRMEVNWIERTYTQNKQYIISETSIPECADPDGLQVWPPK